jgi:3-oxoacyl-[acyl-carrier-protein] synthase-3
MNGREVFKFATRVIGQSCQRVLAKAGLGIEDIDWIVPHQANMRIIRAAARAMDVPLEQFVINIEKYANTGAASVPIAICEALDSGQIQPDDTLLVSSFGAGLTWATAILQMAPTPQHIHRQDPVRQLTAVPA